MKRSKFLSLSALYLISHTALATEQSQQVQTESDRVSTEEVMSAIRTEVVAATRLADEFESLAGSRQNAEKLVVGLRNAKPVTITATSITPPPQHEVSFTPPTRPLSFPDIHKALSLAQAQLRSKNIVSPTPAQLGASLAGGTLPNAQGDITPVVGILPLHQRGMSWDQIARALHVALPKRVATVQRETRVD